MRPRVVAARSIPSDVAVKVGIGGGSRPFEETDEDKGSQYSQQTHRKESPGQGGHGGEQGPPQDGKGQESARPHAIGQPSGRDLKERGAKNEGTEDLPHLHRGQPVKSRMYFPAMETFTRSM